MWYLAALVSSLPHDSPINQVSDSRVQFEPKGNAVHVIVRAVYSVTAVNVRESSPKTGL